MPSIERRKPNLIGRWPVAAAKDRTDAEQDVPVIVQVHDDVQVQVQNGICTRLICGALIAFSACSDVQTVQLGELAGARAGVGSVFRDAAVSLPSGEANAGAVAAARTMPTAADPPQPSAADSGAQKPEAGADIDIDGDGDGDNDESSEEAAESDRSRADEDAGEPSDD